MANTTIYPFGTAGVLSSAIGIDTLIKFYHHFRVNGDDWIAGGIDAATGTITETGYITPALPLTNGKGIMINYTPIAGFEFVCWAFNSDGSPSEAVAPIHSSVLNISLSTATGWLRIALMAQEGHSYNLSSAELDMLELNLFLPKEHSDISFRNPLLLQDLPDPTIWYGEDGYHYLLATNNTKALESISIYRSKNFVMWEEIGRPPFTAEVSTELKAAGVLNGNYYWAPDVKKMKSGKWNMYLCKPTNGSWGGIAVLSSDHPTFGYEFVRFITPDREEFIDPFVEYDFDGKLWMFLGAAGIYRRELQPDGTDFTESSSWTHVAGLARNASNNPGLQKTFEGACLYYRKGYWYLFVSAGNWTTDNYKVKVARSASLTGTFTDRSGNPATEGYAEEVISSLDGYFWGPGHHAPLVADFGNRTWMIFHSHCVALNDTGKRAPCLTEIVWDNEGWPSAKYKHPMFVGEGTAM